jgi:hypothetical protein
MQLLGSKRTISAKACWATVCCRAKRYYIPLRLPVVRIILYNRPLRVADGGPPVPNGDDFGVKNEDPHILLWGIKRNYGVANQSSLARLRRASFTVVRLTIAVGA